MHFEGNSRKFSFGVNSALNDDHKVSANCESRKKKFTKVINKKTLQVAKAVVSRKLIELL